MNDIVWLTMRRMRTPLVVLLLVYFSSVFAFALMPGVDETGQPVHVGFLDASYFVLILATTIGFGEVPFAFTPGQRMLVFAIILPNVVAWLYSIGAILGLFLDTQFREVLNRNRFAQRVRWLGDPFYIVAGCGNTGSLVVRGLRRRGLHAVILERNPDVVHRLSLEEDFAHSPALNADPTERSMLELAGLYQENCHGVIVTTNDDHANLTVAITAKLLRPELTVLARSEEQSVSDNMKSFGTDYIVNPYAIFAERLSLALVSPSKYLVQDWLISMQGIQLRTRLDPPDGRWIVCGAGRFGSRMLAQLEANGLPYTVVESHPERVARYDSAVLGRGTEEHTLLEAGVKDAVGIIAGTGNDIDNLSIVMTALQLNHNLFVVTRQDRHQNDALFDASGAHLVAKRSQIVARRILALVTTPLLQIFLQHLIQANDEFANRTAGRLKAVLNKRARSIWVIELHEQMAESLKIAKKDGIRLKLRHITHNSRSELGESLACVCLLIERGAQRIFLPDDERELMENDRLLFAGRGHARKEMHWALNDPNMLLGYVTRKQLPRGMIWRWLWRRRKQSRNSF